MKGKWTTEEILKQVEKLGSWYHKIDLGHGIITPGHDWGDKLWDNIRKTRKHIDYLDKKVLDVGSWDGMFVFEAEKLGANMVVATDCMFSAYKNFLFCRDVLGSKAIPFYNVSPYQLFKRLDVFLQSTPPISQNSLFDIVQLTGVIYHLRDPMLALSQARSVLRIGGYLLIETAIVDDDDSPFMLFNGIPPKDPKPGYWYRVYKDETTWWAPSLSALKEMLSATLFEPILETINIMPQMISNEMYSSKSIKYKIARGCLVARAISKSEVNYQHSRELERQFRNPGLDSINFM